MFELLMARTITTFDRKAGGGPAGMMFGPLPARASVEMIVLQTAGEIRRLVRPRTQCSNRLAA
jgi:hypothetical protein